MSVEQIRSRLASFPGWSLDEDKLLKTFRFPSYMEGIRFVNRVAEIAEELNHHPDLNVGYRRVDVSCTTHDAGGVTEKDFALISRIEALEDW